MNNPILEYYLRSLLEQRFERLAFEVIRGDDQSVTFGGDYFDAPIHISAIATIPRDLGSLTFWGKGRLPDTETMHSFIAADGRQVFDDFDDLAEQIVTFCQQRPFTAVEHEGDLYQLLDPNGFHYIGEYISLDDAERTSEHNFRIRR